MLEVVDTVFMVANICLILLFIDMGFRLLAIEHVEPHEWKDLAIIGTACAVYVTTYVFMFGLDKFTER